MNKILNGTFTKNYAEVPNRKTNHQEKVNQDKMNLKETKKKQIPKILNGTTDKGRYAYPTLENTENYITFRTYIEIKNIPGRLPENSRR